MTRPTATLIETGIANIASVAAAFGRCGLDVTTTQDADVARRSGLLVLPGVGAFDAGMRSLDRLGMLEMLRERAERDAPLLAVCLGMQLLGSASDESPGVEGLGIIDAKAGAFDPSVRAPQMGWNQIRPDRECTFLTPGYAYFANSFRFTTTPAGWRSALADHGGSFVAAIERGKTLACQFHPELSGPWGLALLHRWIEKSLEAAPC
ncbi:MAG: imidazole glycerol phosphate synthase subunit HisH [Planctomycetota bacterium]|nr:MAG: imidazole glycerol phosphate synthase subunit HisH [Planctomycetota bacterium]